MNKYSTKVGSFKYYLQYFWENFVIGFKTSFEYKANFFSLATANIFFLTIMIFFGHIFISNFGEIISWKLQDFILFIVLSNILFHIAGLFWFQKSLKYQIFKLKKFNSFLYIPGNRFFNFSLYASTNFCYFITQEIIILFFYSVFFSTFSTQFFYLIILISILLIVLYISTIHFFISISWISLDFGDQLTGSFLQFENKGTRTFPGNFLFNSPLKFLLFMSPAYFIATLLIPLANGDIPMYFTNYLLIILGIIIISSIGIYINWTYGLKHYEAWD